MKKVNLLVAALFMTAIVSAQNWTLDKAHAKLGFTATHMMISEVEGFFKSFDVKLVSSQADFTDAVIELSADVNSINTDVEKRDAHLKSPDFFDVEKFPTLTFKGLALKKIEGKNYKLQGNLTMHGVTRFVELAVIYKGTVTHPYTKKLVAGFKITGTIKRSDFGIGSTMPESMISDEIQILANAEFIKD